jgi:AcrR family transcriptional regulator
MPGKKQVKLEKSRKSSREALLEAATRLFAERGPAAVSTREIAAAAEVNSGLIHRHFGTKDELLRETMQRLASEISASAGAEGGDPATLLGYFEATRESAYWRLLARCLLDGRDIEELQSDFPTISHLSEQLRALQNEGAIVGHLDPRILAVALAAMGLGWLIFEPFLVAAAGLEGGDRNTVGHEVRQAVLSLL